jgi:hypothetical protein
VTVVLLAVVGSGRALFNLATRTLLQRAVPAEVVGRVFGVAEALAVVGLAVGSAMVPLLVATGGTATAVVGTAAILPLVALVGARALLAVDAAARVPVVEIALLRSLRIFRALPAPALEGLARSLELVRLAAGEVLICEGEPGDRFYAVAGGRLQVTSAASPSPPTCAATASARSPCCMGWGAAHGHGDGHIPSDRVRPLPGGLPGRGRRPHAHRAGGHRRGRWAARPGPPLPTFTARRPQPDSASTWPAPGEPRTC